MAGCQELLQLLDTNWRDDEAASSRIATHIRSCPCCYHGMVRLAEELLPDVHHPLSCDECQWQLPDYYEATRPADEYPLVAMAPTDLAAVAFHLSHCATCHEEYEELVRLSELEERGEW